MSCVMCVPYVHVQVGRQPHVSCVLSFLRQETSFLAGLSIINDCLMSPGIYLPVSALPALGFQVQTIGLGFCYMNSGDETQDLVLSPQLLMKFFF